jgi:branched-chain amino acid transport system substrate-binding protein
MRLRRLIAGAACLAVTGAALAACSSDGADAAGGGDAIVIGTICSCSGAASSVTAKSSEGISAWVKQVNANGGLNGHNVKLIVKDDAGEPAKALQAAKELVEKEKVIAIVGEASLVDEAFQSYVEGKKIPVVGGLAAEKTFLVSPTFFASGTSTVVAIFGMMQQAKDAGKKKVGTLFCAETPICAEIDAIGPVFAKIIGIGWESAKISATQPKYTAQCLSMKDDGVDALFIGHVSPVVARVAADCSKAGYKPVQVGQLNPLAAEMLASPEFEDAILTGNNAAYTDDKVPGIAEYLKGMEAYDKGITSDPQFTFPVLQAWAGGKLFEAAAAAVKLSPTSTSEDVKKGLYSLKNETLDGIAAPLNFKEGKPAFPSCYFNASIKGGKLVGSAQEPVCLTPDALNSLTKVLQAG